MNTALQQYIRMYRKRTGLSQVDVGLLMGSVAASADMSRHELGSRLPNLRTALAYEIILQVPIAKIFEGLYADIEEEISSRVPAIRDALTGELPRALADVKTRHLSEVLEQYRRNHGDPSAFS